MNAGKKITIYLVDGLPKGIRKAKIDQWNGKAVCSPRNRLKELLAVSEICDAVSVYFLIGEAEDGGLITVYVGEADGFKNRINSHNSQKTQWRDVVVFYGEDLTKASIKYLETVCIERLKKAGRCILENVTSPAKPTIPEEDISGLEIFYENIALIMPLFGYDIFVQEEILAKNKQEILVCPGKGVKAEGVLLPDGKLKVLKGSEAVLKDVASFESHFYYPLKKELLKTGRLVAEKDKLVFTDDYVFDSPSAAAAIILARSASGPQEWRDKKGKKLKEILETEI